LDEETARVETPGLFFVLTLVARRWRQRLSKGPGFWRRAAWRRRASVLAVPGSCRQIQAGFRL